MLHYTRGKHRNIENVFYWMAGGGWKINSLPLVDKEMEVKQNLTWTERSFSAQFLSHRKVMLITFRISVFLKYLSLFLLLPSGGINRASPKKVSMILMACLSLRKKRLGYILDYPDHTSRSDPNTFSEVGTWNVFQAA